jgi:transposase
MNKEQQRTAKCYFIAKRQEGSPWQVAAIQARLPISQSQAYRLMKAVRERGEAALFDERHGHPSKLRGAARAFLEETVWASSSDTFIRHPGPPARAF